MLPSFPAPSFRPLEAYLTSCLVLQSVRSVEGSEPWRQAIRPRGVEICGFLNRRPDGVLHYLYK